MTEYQFGRRSERELATCDPLLQKVAREALRDSPYDFAIIEGNRPIERQRALFRAGKSRIDGVTRLGMHNHSPSNAFDFIPTPLTIGDLSAWEAEQWRFSVVAGVILSTGKRLGIPLRWGGDWDGDGTRADQSLHDLPHIELARSGA